MIGEAGNGKSCELLNLAYEIELNQKEIPVYVKLNDYQSHILLLIKR